MTTPASCTQLRIADLPRDLSSIPGRAEVGHNVKETEFLVMLESLLQGEKI